MIAALSQQVIEIAPIERNAVEIALGFLAADAVEESRLPERLHPFGNNLQAKAMAHRHDGAHDRSSKRIGRKVANEGLVYLETIERKALEVAEIRVARAEIV